MDYMVGELEKMKISFDVDVSDSVWELLDGFTVVLLKQIKKDAETDLACEWMHGEDKRLAQQRMEAANVLLDYYGVKNED
jgi:hypothetical protein